MEGNLFCFYLLIDVVRKIEVNVFAEFSWWGNKAEITWIDECKRRGQRKIDQANDRQTEKKGLAEPLGRCLGARLASAGELNTTLDAHCICVFLFLYLCICVLS